MTELTKKQLIEEAKLKIAIEKCHPNPGMARVEGELFKIALAALEVEPIGFRCRRNDNLGDWSYVYHREPDDFERKHLVIEGIYAAPPAPVVPEEKPMPNPLSMYAVDAVAAIAEVRGWNACRAAMLQSGNFRENKNSSTNNFREIAETSTNYPVIPSEVLSAILKVAKIRADFDDFDGDRRGIGDCLDEAEQELIVTINKYASQLAAEPIATNDVREQTAVPPVPVIQADVAQAIEKLKRKLVECNRYNYCADAVKGVEYACHAAMLQGSQPVSQTYNLPELIEGMEVSIDVSTCDADLGNRYFGTVTEALELDTAKNGYILLVQDAEPNFDVNGNSPVTPDGWISCSELMPKKNQNVLISVNFDSDLVEPLICSARYTGSTFRRGDATIKPGNGIEQATHWMLLPEPPQGVNDELA
ncbi:TPA: DUF551 domain-containing protein [Escherichia coli]|nr:DUF551 domain-containing protein [Escherichia coli]MBX8838529.1 DUF551 domain-containing protein [Escherichia coli]HCY3285576.1 DUF551 domain-containing protein [Escherichia coli]